MWYENNYLLQGATETMFKTFCLTLIWRLLYIFLDKICFNAIVQKVLYMQFVFLLFLVSYNVVQSQYTVLPFQCSSLI